MSELRQRIAPLLNIDSEKKGGKFRSSLLNADIFHKPKEDYCRTQTPWGSAVSFVTLFILIVLVLYNVAEYWIGTSAYKTELSIEADNSGYMPLNIDVDFPDTPCHKLRVDLIDSAGTIRLNITHQLHKIPIQRNGDVAFSGSDFYDLSSGEFMYNSTFDPESPSYCGQCIVSGDEDFFLEKSLNSTCCNSCDDVLSFYKSHGVTAPKERRIQQCLYGISLRSPGCKVSGQLRLKRVRGALVFGPRGNLKVGPMYSLTDYFDFVATHRINSLFFGSDNVQRFPHSGFPVLNGRYVKSLRIEEIRYVLHVVPTNYITSSHSRKKEEQSFEYSARTRSSPIHIKLSGFPSVAFFFDLSPIKITNIFEREPFSRFLVRLCVIVGDVFVISALADDAIQFIERHKFRKFPK